MYLEEKIAKGNVSALNNKIVINIFRGVFFFRRECSAFVCQKSFVISYANNGNDCARAKYISSCDEKDFKLFWRVFFTLFRFCAIKIASPASKKFSVQNFNE